MKIEVLQDGSIAVVVVVVESLLISNISALTIAGSIAAKIAALRTGFLIIAAEIFFTIKSLKSFSIGTMWFASSCSTISSQSI